MRLKLIAGFGFALITGFAQPSLASPYYLSATNFTGLQGVASGATIKGYDPTLPSQGNLVSQTLVRTTSTTTTPNGTTVDYPSQSIPINNDFSFQLGVLDPNSVVPAFTGPYLNVTGHATGSIAGKATDPSLTGGYSATIGGAQLVGQSSTTPVPTALLDLAAHPERIHVSAQVVGGSQNILQTNLTIDPTSTATINAVSAPEPSTLAIFAAAAGGVAIRYRRKRNG